MDCAFYTFADAFKEASRRQGIEYSDFDNEKAKMDYVRRQFRSFLAALSIEYTNFKRPEQISDFRYPEGYENGNNTGEDDIRDEYIAHCKNVEYSFNCDGVNFVVDFICDWKKPEYKRMRRGNFSIDGKKQYRKIISAVKSNMAALGYTKEIIFHQECGFWHNIVNHSAYSILDYLEIGTLLEQNGKLQEIAKSLSALETDDLIYVNNLVCQDYFQFQEKWLNRIEKALQYRRDFESKSVFDPDLEDFLKLIRTNLSPDSHDNDPNPCLDLRSQKKIDDEEKDYIDKVLILLLIIVNGINIPEFESPIGSKALYDQIIEETLLTSQESLKADDSSL